VKHKCEPTTNGILMDIHISDCSALSSGQMKTISHNLVFYPFQPLLGEQGRRYNSTAHTSGTRQPTAASIAQRACNNSASWYLHNACTFKTARDKELNLDNITSGTKYLREHRLKDLPRYLCHHLSINDRPAAQLNDLILSSASNFLASFFVLLHSLSECLWLC
jgi:hypothetical protein